MTHDRLIPDRPVHEATRSWWIDAQTREAFTAAAKRESERMSRSPQASTVAPMVVGRVEGRER